MLNIVTALKIEADPIIKKYNLKCYNNVYQNKYINLIITGQGKIKSAINTALLLNQFKFPTLNIGIAGSNKYNINKGFFIDKIIDYDTNLEYFPDFFPKKSTTLTTISKIGKYFSLTDMEGSGFFEACYKFLNVNEIILYKIVSDTLKNPINKQEIPNLISTHLEIIDFLLDNIQTKKDINKEIEEYLQKAKEKMHLTQTQENELKNLFYYLIVSNKKIPYFPKIKQKKEVSKFLNYLTNLIS
ncbi:hypothetical protein [Caminibacter mediatlanticus]|uniref:5'-methylthioadenosine/S-adenosylhomocysteine nucleosidase n=1 Tax=Caminibacter mediatlanticus TB-2 TaxID=391592 RepID=A0AAI9AIV9_9BACT|nr:hypothetical protein [Caminibacter mediatlanticus]EDM24462.1 hypothetical protein CMTB2_03063 [Caminibacter mediatlanticus TB-2]